MASLISAISSESSSKEIRQHLRHRHFYVCFVVAIKERRERAESASDILTRDLKIEIKHFLFFHILFLIFEYNYINFKSFLSTPKVIK